MLLESISVFVDGSSDTLDSTGRLSILQLPAVQDTHLDIGDRKREKP